MKTLSLLLFAGLLSAQSLKPTIGAHYSGGLSYDMEQEPISIQAGLIYTPKHADLIMSNVGVSFNAYHEPASERIGKTDTFYVLRLQFAKEFVEYYNFTYYMGYANNFHNDIMRKFDGPFKTNLAYGFGFQITDDHITGEILYESIAGYPHLSVGVNYNIADLLKKKR